MLKQLKNFEKGDKKINFVDILLNPSLTNKKIQMVMKNPKISLHNFIPLFSTIRQSTAFFAKTLTIA